MRVRKGPGAARSEDWTIFFGTVMYNGAVKGGDVPARRKMPNVIATSASWPFLVPLP
jgi:hypothetical protein